VVTPTTALVLKFGGELLEDRAHLATVVSAVSAIAEAQVPTVVVHGGGKEIDAALSRAGIEKRQVDGLRITDEATLDIVVSVLAGAINTRLVAALNAEGIPAVGLTGADCRCALCVDAPPHITADGRSVPLGRVGIPSDAADMRVLQTLVANGLMPVLACIGIAEDGRLLNVNADTLAGHLASKLAARRLVMAGTTAGVLNSGVTVPALDTAGIRGLVGDGTATAGMVAKLRACEHAIARGVEEVIIVDGRDPDALVEAAIGTVPATATRITTGGVVGRV
jgi:acetylglutamate kinase